MWFKWILLRSEKAEYGEGGKRQAKLARVTQFFCPTNRTIFHGRFLKMYILLILKCEDVFRKNGPTEKLFREGVEH